MGSLTKQAIVEVKNNDMPIGLYIFIINAFFWPGMGTFIAASYTEQKENKCKLVGILQWLTTWLLVGWIWSVHVGW